MYELRRENFQGDVCVYRGTGEECRNWLNDTIKRNRYEYQLTVNLSMQPVWIMQDRVFYLKKIKAS